MLVGNGDMFEKTLVKIDEELGKNVTTAAGILGSLTKKEDTKSVGDSFEFKHWIMGMNKKKYLFKTTNFFK